MAVSKMTCQFAVTSSRCISLRAWDLLFMLYLMFLILRATEYDWEQSFVLQKKMHGK